MNPPHLAAPGAGALDVGRPDRRELGAGPALSVGAAPRIHGTARHPNGPPVAAAIVPAGIQTRRRGAAECARMVGGRPA